MNKKKLILIIAAGLISFAGTFAIGWFNRRTKLAEAQKATEEMTEMEIAEEKSATERVISKIDQTDTRIRSLTESQLRDLVLDVRGKIEEYNARLDNLQKEEERVQISQNLLKEDIEELKDMRLELNATLAEIKSERKKLAEAQVVINQQERDNFRTMAATYDRMNAGSAAKILTQMSQLPGQQNNLEDVVKILFYMSDRTQAKVMGELVSIEPRLAAVISQKLKYITEED